MKRTFAVLGILSCMMTLALVPAAQAQDASTDILATVPSDAWAVVSIRNAAELDQKLMTLGQRLNAPILMSPLQMLKGALGLVSGVNDNGSVALVLMPVDNVMMVMQGLVALAPAQDYAALTSMMQLQPVEGMEGISQGLIAGSPSFVAEHNGYAVLAPTPAGVQAFIAAKEKPGMGTVWTKHQLDRFSQDDVTVWLNFDAIVASPAFQAMVMPMLMAMPGGAANVQSLQETRSVVISARLDKSGVFVGFYEAFKEGTDSAKAVASMTPASGSLLTGLPAENYMVTFGMHGNAKVWEKAAQVIEQTIAHPMVAMQLQAAGPEKFERVKTVLLSLIRETRDVSFSASALPAGPDGLLGMAKVVTVSGDAAGKCSQLADLIGAIMAMAPEEVAAEVQNVVKYTPDAEKIGGVSVNHLVFAIDQAEGARPDDIAKMKKVVGKEGLLIRIAAVGDKHLVSTLGGGPERMQKVIELVKSGAAPLDANEGIAKAGKMLSHPRSMEGFVAVDQILKTITEIGKVMDEPADVPVLAAVDMPVAMGYAPVGDGAFQADLFAPTELIVAIKDAVMSAQAVAAPTGTSVEPTDAPAESGTPGV